MTDHFDMTADEFRRRYGNQSNDVPDEMTLEQFLTHQAGRKTPPSQQAARDYRKRTRPKKSDYVEQLVAMIELAGLPSPTHYGKNELLFARSAGRRWRFDIAWSDLKVAAEIEGGIFGNPVTCHNCGTRVKAQTKTGTWFEVRTGGRHNWGKGFERDVEKYNEAAIMGWKVLKIIPSHIENGFAVDWLERILNQ